MRADGIDERNVWGQRRTTDFVVFIYEGGNDNEAGASWSVDSYLLSDADLPAAFIWLDENLPVDCCWSFGVVTGPVSPTAKSDVRVSWLIGGDVLNIAPSQRDPEEQRLAQDMLRRRHQIDLLR